MKLGIIAGNRLLPIACAKSIKEKFKDAEVVAVAFKKETDPAIAKYLDRIYWVDFGKLAALRRIIGNEKLPEWIMVGQVNPLRIFRRKDWDEELKSLVSEDTDFRPHNIFRKIIEYLEKEGITFLDSTKYLSDNLARGGEMAGLEITKEVKSDIDFGREIISRYVELDIGQTIAVKNRSVVALEALEGTDKAIIRGYRLGGKYCTVLKFSKANQDLRFDVPVVGLSTLRLLKRIKAASLVLEKGKTLILEKERFLSLARAWKIPVFGEETVRLF